MRMRTISNEEFETLQAICRMHQHQLHGAMKNALKEIYAEKFPNPIWIDTEKYLYFKGTTPILLVAHLDTVFKRPNRQIYFDQEKNRMWGGAEGLGADDRAGVFGILWLLLYSDCYPHVLFVHDEEIGGHGSIAAVKDQLINPDDFKYIIELDRANQKDCVFYDCDNKEFTQYVEGFGFETAEGTFSDISILCPAWKVAGVNLSIGYQHEHSLAEMLVVHWMMDTLDKVQLMLDDADNIKRFDYIPAKSNFPTCVCSVCGRHSSYAGSMFIPSKYTQKRQNDMMICIDCMVDHVDYCDTCGEMFEVEAAGDRCPVCQEVKSIVV